MWTLIPNQPAQTLHTHSHDFGHCLYCGLRVRATETADGALSWRQLKTIKSPKLAGEGKGGEQVEADIISLLAAGVLVLTESVGQDGGNAREATRRSGLSQCG